MVLYVLFQEIKEIAADALVQMGTLMTSHIVRFARVDEIIGLSTIQYALVQERTSVLGYHCGIIFSDNDLQSSFQVLGLGNQAGLGVSLRIGLRGVHVTLAVHHFIPTPVDDRTTSYAYLEYVRMVGHHGNSHETAKTPAMYAYAVSVYIRQAFQELYAFQLVTCFFLSQLAEGSLLKFLASILTASIVEDEEQVALLRHVGFPSTGRIMPPCVYVVGMRATIYIYNSGILLVGVEVHGLHHAPIEVSHAVSGFQCPAYILWHVVAFPWVWSLEVARALGVFRVYYLQYTRHGGLLIVVEDIFATLA